MARSFSHGFAPATGGNAVDLASEVGRVASGDLQAIAFTRADATDMLVSLRNVVSKEADLVCERFNEPDAAD